MHRLIYPENCFTEAEPVEKQSGRGSLPVRGSLSKLLAGYYCEGVCDNILHKIYIYIYLYICGILGICRPQIMLDLSRMKSGKIPYFLELEEVEIGQGFFSGVSFFS